MNAREEKFLGVVKKLKECLENLENFFGPDELYDDVFVKLESVLRLANQALHFLNALGTFYISQFPGFKFPELLEKCQADLISLNEKVNSEKIKREKKSYIKKNASPDDKIEKRKKEKIDEQAEKLVAVIRRELKGIIKDDLVIKPLINIVRERFFNEQIPPVETYSKALQELYKLKTKRKINDFLIKFAEWTEAHLPAILLLQPYEKFILALKELALNKLLLKSLISKSKKDRSIGEFFVLINQIKNPKIATCGDKDIEKVNIVFKVTDIFENITSFREHLMQDKDALHAKAIENAKAWLQTNPKEEIKNNLREYILQLQRAVEDLPVNEEVKSLLIQFQAQHELRFPGELMPVFIKRKPLGEDGEVDFSKDEMRARVAIHERNVGYARNWLKQKPEDKLKEIYLSHIHHLEFVLMDEPENTTVIELLAELKNKYKEIYVEQEIPLVTKKPTLVRAHTRERSRTVSETKDVPVIMLPIRPVTLANIDEREDLPEEQTPKAHRGRSDSQQLKKRYSMPRILHGMFSPRKSSPRPHSAREEKEQKEEKKI